jgi:hypothetical protein
MAEIVYDKASGEELLLLAHGDGYVSVRNRHGHVYRLDGMRVGPRQHPDRTALWAAHIKDALAIEGSRYSHEYWTLMALYVSHHGNLVNMAQDSLAWGNIIGSFHFKLESLGIL